MNSLLRLSPFIVFLTLCATLLIVLYRKDDALHSAAIGMAFDDVYVNALPIVSGDERALPTDRAAIYNLFASWCTPCQAELAEFAAFKEKYDIPLIGIAWKDRPEHTPAWLEMHGNPYDQVRSDDTGHLGISLGMRGIPESFVVRDGVIVAYHSGAMTVDMLEETFLPVLPTALRKQ